MPEFLATISQAAGVRSVDNFYQVQGERPISRRILEKKFQFFFLFDQKRAHIRTRQRERMKRRRKKKKETIEIR